MMRSIELVTNNVWNDLTEFARKSGEPAFVAVAYFGKGAAKLLPIASGSTLVVDASEAAVKAGQTHPKDLLVLLKRGVAIHSFRGLHAKVFTFGETAYVGSANASSHSANVLQEAVVRVTEPGVVAAIREFVVRLAIEPLGPSQLARLQKLYRAPAFQGGSPTRSGGGLRVVSTLDVELPEKDQQAMDAGEEVAAAAAPEKFEITSFWWKDPPPCRVGELIVIVHKSSRGRNVSPPGRVQSIKRHAGTNGPKAFVYVEIPKGAVWPALSSIPDGVRLLISRGGKRSDANAQLIQSALRS